MKDSTIMDIIYMSEESINKLLECMIVIQDWLLSYQSDFSQLSSPIQSLNKITSYIINYNQIIVNMLEEANTYNVLK